MENELKKLEELVGQMDFLFQEGVFINKAEWDRLWELEKAFVKNLRAFENEKQLTSDLPY